MLYTTEQVTRERQTDADVHRQGDGDAALLLHHTRRGEPISRRALRGKLQIAALENNEWSLFTQVALVLARIWYVPETMPCIYAARPMRVIQPSARHLKKLLLLHRTVGVSTRSTAGRRKRKSDLPVG